MREILFRGKRIDNGEWVEGYYIGEQKMVEKKAHWILDKNDIFGRFHYRSIDPNTLGQYTGLTDKNGKKIFEGDIVKYYSSYSKKLTGESAVVCYGNFNCTCCKGVYGWSFGRHEEGDIRNHMNYVVIGNIHDNPELLEVNNEANMD